MKENKLLKISLGITYVFIFIIIAFTIGLPWVVDWYVKIEEKDC